MNQQPAKAVMMIRPASFGYNPQTASSNAFQELPPEDAQLAKRAVHEFDAFVETLRNERIGTIVIDDEPHPPKPDAVFCNNWVSFHPGGTMILYPMMAPNRRLERRKDIAEKIAAAGFEIKRIIDYSGYEKEGKYLESTGSMTFDYENGAIYASLSPRTHPGLLAIVSRDLNMELVVFNAVDRDGRPIYHTNVVMTIGAGFAVICAEAIRDAGERKTALDRLEKTNHEIVAIDYAQLYAFAGNMLQAVNRDGEKLLVMSETAYRSLNAGQVRTLEKYNRIVKAAVPTIETFGGGSVRCMMANIQ